MAFVSIGDSPFFPGMGPPQLTGLHSLQSGTGGGDTVPPEIVYVSPEPDQLQDSSTIIIEVRDPALTGSCLAVDRDRKGLFEMVYDKAGGFTGLYSRSQVFDLGTTKRFEIVRLGGWQVQGSLLFSTIAYDTGGN